MHANSVNTLILFASYNMASSNRDQCMCLALLFILGTLASQATSRSLQDASMYEKHKLWMARYGREYKGMEEEEKRFNIFKDNVEYIESFNKATNKPYKLGGQSICRPHKRRIQTKK